MAKLEVITNPFSGKQIDFHSDKTLLAEVILEFYEKHEEYRKLLDTQKYVLFKNDVRVEDVNFGMYLGYFDVIRVVATVHDPASISLIIGATLTALGAKAALDIAILVTIGIGMMVSGLMGLLTGLFAADAPGSSNSSPTYQWEGPQSIASQAYPIPFTYGKSRTAPNVIQSFIDGGITWGVREISNLEALVLDSSNTTFDVNIDDPEDSTIKRCKVAFSDNVNWTGEDYQDYYLFVLGTYSGRDYVVSKYKIRYNTTINGTTNYILIYSSTWTGGTPTNGTRVVIGKENAFIVESEGGSGEDLITVSSLLYKDTNNQFHGIQKIFIEFKNHSNLCSFTYIESDSCDVTIKWKRTGEVAWDFEQTISLCFVNMHNYEIDVSSVADDCESIAIELSGCSSYFTDKVYNRVSTQVYTESVDDTKDSYLNMLCSFGHGEIENITNIELNDQPLDTFEDTENDVLEVWYDTRLGTNLQTPITYFHTGGSYVSGSFPYKLDKTGQKQIISCLFNSDTIQFVICFSGQLYHVGSTSGKFKDCDVTYLIEYSTDKENWTTLNDSSGNSPFVISTEYSNDVISKFFYSEVILISGNNTGAYYLRITRTASSFDEEDNNNSGDLSITGITTFNGEAYNYSNIALLGLRLIASEKLNGSPPNCTALIWGRKLTVPDLRYSGVNVKFANCYYDPYDETYRYYGSPLAFDTGPDYDDICAYNLSGGVVTSVTQWSDNPAWCYYDTLTNVEYGLGHKIDSTRVNWSDVISAGEWSDQLVTSGARILLDADTVFSDGVTITVDVGSENVALDAWKNKFVVIKDGNYLGQIRRIFTNTAKSGTTVTITLYTAWTDTPANGTQIAIHTMEKRHILNYTCDTSNKAIDFISKLYSSFSLIPNWCGYQYTLRYEGARAVSNFYTMGNFLKGKGYNETINFRKPTHYTATFPNEDLGYKRDYAEQVIDTFSYGNREERVSVDLIGYTKRWRIQKRLKFLEEKANLTSILSSEVQIDALQDSVGDVIAIAHDSPSWGYSGNVVDSGNNYVVLDRAVNIESANTYKIYVRVLNTFVEKTVDSQATIDAELGPGFTEADTETIYITGTWDTNPYPFWSKYSIGDITNTIYKEYSIEEIVRTRDNTVKVLLLEYDEDVYTTDIDVLNED